MHFPNISKASCSDTELNPEHWTSLVPEGIDPYTQKPLDALIQRNFKLNIPYFLVNWNRDGVEIYANAPSFIRNYTGFHDFTDPENKQPIRTFKIFKISPEKNRIKFFSDETNLADHKTKYIGACNAHQTESRGEKCFYMAVHFFEKFKNPDPSKDKSIYLKKMMNWLDLAIKDYNLKAKLLHVEFIQKGNQLIEASPEKALLEMKDIVTELKMTSKRDLCIVAAYCDMLEDAELYNGIDDDFSLCRTKARVYYAQNKESTTP